MTKQQAEQLVQFVKDHDTRAQASVREDEEGAAVVLTFPDGKEHAPVRSLEAYEQEFITGRDPGPTIREAWEKWVK